MAHALAAAGIARMSHVSIETADLDRALAFYENIFGFQTILQLDQKGPEFEKIVGVPGASSRMIRGLIGGVAVVQLWSHDWRPPVAEKRTLMSFEVRDVAAAYRELSAAGVSCRSEPVAFENATAFVMLDPDNHPIEIIQWQPHTSPYGG